MVFTRLVIPPHAAGLGPCVARGDDSLQLGAVYESLLMRVVKKAKAASFVLLMFTKQFDFFSH